MWKRDCLNWILQGDKIESNAEIYVIHSTCKIVYLIFGDKKWRNIPATDEQTK